MSASTLTAAPPLTPAMRTNRIGHIEPADTPDLAVHHVNAERRSYEWLRAATAKMGIDEQDEAGLFLLKFEVSANLYARQAYISELCAPWFEAQS